MLLYFCNTGITIKGIVHPKIKVWSFAHLHVSQDFTKILNVAYSCSFRLGQNYFTASKKCKNNQTLT